MIQAIDAAISNIHTRLGIPANYLPTCLCSFDGSIYCHNYCRRISPLFYKKKEDKSIVLLYNQFIETKRQYSKRLILGGTIK